MERLHYAIVLSSKTTHSYYTLLFDQHLGTIEVLLDTKRGSLTMTRGALITYTLRSHGRRYRATSLEIVAMPDIWVLDNIWFLHHLIELITFFLPRDSSAEDIFTLSCLLYKPLETGINTTFFKNFFLCKFFIMVGLYPEPITLDDKHFVSCIVRENTFIHDKEKYVFIEKKMIQWLHECIRLHPHADRLKTTIMEPLYGYQ